MRAAQFLLTLAISLYAVTPAQGSGALMGDLLKSWKGACDGKHVFNQADSFGGAASLRPYAVAYQSEPDNEGLFFLAARYYHLRSEWPTLKQICIEANRRHPSWPAPPYFLGQCASAQMDDEDALSEFRRAYELMPCLAPAILAYTNALVETGHYADAVKIADAGLKLCLSGNKEYRTQCVRQELRFQKGNAYMGLNEPQKAIEAMEPEMKESNYGSQTKLGEALTKAYARNKQWTKARDAATFVISKNPGNPIIFKYRAMAYSNLGQPQLALKDINTFLAREPVVGSRYMQEAHALKASIYDTLGKKDLASNERKLSNEGTTEFYTNSPFRSKQGKERSE